MRNKYNCRRINKILVNAVREAKKKTYKHCSYTVYFASTYPKPLRDIIGPYVKGCNSYVFFSFLLIIFRKILYVQNIIMAQEKRAGRSL